MPSIRDDYKSLLVPGYTQKYENGKLLGNGDEHPLGWYAFRGPYYVHDVYMVKYPPYKEHERDINGAIISRGTLPGDTGVVILGNVQYTYDFRERLNAQPVFHLEKLTITSAVSSTDGNGEDDSDGDDDESENRGESEGSFESVSDEPRVFEIIRGSQSKERLRKC
jgi:hypothetical protein